MCNLFEKWQWMSFPSFMRLTTKTSANISARQNKKDKELKEGTNLHRCSTIVIKELHRRHTKNTPAVTDGGNPSKEETGQHSTAREIGRQ